MRVGFDLDGPVHGFIEQCNVIRKKNKEKPFKAGNWHFYRAAGMNDKQWIEWCNKAADEGLLFNAEPLPGAVEAVKKVKELGHTVVVATDRSFGRTPKVSQDITHKFLDTYFTGLIDEVHFGADKTKYQLDTMVEDKLENYDALIHAGTPTWLVNRPWNQVPGRDGRNRIENVIDYATAIENVTHERVLDLTFV